MGLFNFIYKLTIIFSNKKKMKVFIILAIVIILIFAWSRGVFAATTDDVNALTNYQLAMQQAVFSQLTDLVNMGVINPSNYNNFINNLKTNFVYINTSVNNNAQVIIHLYRINRVDNGVVYNSPQDFTTEGSWEVGATLQSSSTEYPCMLAEFRGPTFVFYYGTPAYLSNATFSTFWLPDACFCLRSNAVNDFLAACKEISEIPPTYSTSDEELQAIASSGFTSVTNSIQQQTNTMTNSINSASSSISNSVNNASNVISNTINSGVASVTNTLTDDSVSVSSDELPTDNTTDPTANGLNSIFTMIQTAFTGTPTSVTFPIPFTNTSFTIEPYYIENSMRKGGLATMVNVIHLYWYYRIYSFIFLKYVELLEHLKEGEFEETMGNIKKEVL